MLRWLSRIVTTLACVIALGATGVLPAHAVTDLWYTCGRVYSSTTADYVDICWGVDVSVAHGHIRGWGEMLANASVVHVQIDKINLGDGTKVLATTSAPANSQYGYVTTETAAATFRCPKYYEVRLYWSIRWRDGTLIRSYTSLYQFNGIGIYCI